MGDEEKARIMRSVKECLKMGCWTVIKSFHVKIILLDKQELIQEIQVRGCHQVFSRSFIAIWLLGQLILCRSMFLLKP